MDIEEKLDSIITLLERIADALEHSDEVQSRATAIELWRIGQGKHPDD